MKIKKVIIQWSITLNNNEQPVIAIKDFVSNDNNFNNLSFEKKMEKMLPVLLNDKSMLISKEYEII